MYKYLHKIFTIRRAPGGGATAILPPLNEMLTIFIGKITSVTSPGGKPQMPVKKILSFS